MNKKETKNNNHPKKTSFEHTFEGKKIIFEIDELAVKSNKSVICRFGDTVVLCSLTVKESSNFLPFFPLTVFFEERAYSVGRIPNVFNKREGRINHFSIKAARMIDRFLRPFFPLEGLLEVQIHNLVLSVDSECSPFLAAAWSSFLVCFLSHDLPFFNQCLATVLIGKKNDTYACNLSLTEMLISPLEIIISATSEKIIMLDGCANEIKEEEIEIILDLAEKKVAFLIHFFHQIADNLLLTKKKKEEKYFFLEKKKEEEIKKTINTSLTNIFLSSSFSWLEKENQIKTFQKELINKFTKENLFLEEKKTQFVLERFFEDCLTDCNKKIIFQRDIRLDGRKLDDIRSLNIKMDFLPNNVHGSAFFARGYTQVLSVVTIGKESEKQFIDSVLFPVSFHKHFIHHYNFPDFAVNKITTFSSLSRREIGHGELVEKTLKFLLPSVEALPYTIRVVSEVFSSDGSSSQASVCAASLALVSSGITPVNIAAGISVGLIDDNILVDINALEDKISEIDFKIAGTEKGVCSFQLDVKNNGISRKKIQECFLKAKNARLFILEEMKKQIISRPKNSFSNIKKIRKIYVGDENMRTIIGPGGRTINNLIKKFGASIEVQPNGFLLIYHTSEEQINNVCLNIKKIIK